MKELEKGNLGGSEERKGKGETDAIIFNNICILKKKRERK